MAKEGEPTPDAPTNRLEGGISESRIGHDIRILRPPLLAGAPLVPVGEPPLIPPPHEPKDPVEPAPQIAAEPRSTKPQTVGGIPSSEVRGLVARGSRRIFP